MLYIATLNFSFGSSFYRAGDEVPEPTQHLIDAGLVKETKVEEPTEAKQEQAPKKHKQ
jgi:hypothetical protein